MANNDQGKELLIQMNKEFRDAVLWVTSFVGIEVFLAFFGNMIVLCVFMSRYHGCTYRYFVMCLAVIDFISSLTTMPGEMVTQLYWYTYPSPELCKAKSFFNVFTVSGEAFCLTAIAVDRYLKVCRPLGKQLTEKIAKYICGVIYLCATILAIPVSVFWGTYSPEYEYGETKINATICLLDKKYEKTSHPAEYAITVEVIVSIALFVMLVLYSIIVRRFIVNRRSHRTYSNNSRASERSTGENDVTTDVTVEVTNGNMSVEDNPNTEGNARRSAFGVNHKVVRKTWIMFILTVSFTITTIMYYTMLSLIANGVLNTLDNSEKAWYFFGFRFVFINHVINPIVYVILDSEFRKHLKDIKDSFLSRLKLK